MWLKLLHAGFEMCSGPSTQGAGTNTHLESRWCAVLILYNLCSTGRVLCVVPELKPRPVMLPDASDGRPLACTCVSLTLKPSSACAVGTVASASQRLMFVVVGAGSSALFQRESVAVLLLPWGRSVLLHRQAVAVHYFKGRGQVRRTIMHLTTRDGSCKLAVQAQHRAVGVPNIATHRHGADLGGLRNRAKYTLFKMAGNLDLRCVLLSDPSTFLAGTKHVSIPRHRFLNPI